MIVIKEEFLTHEKLARAVDRCGYEALAVWLAIKSYCGSNLTDGFISEDDMAALKLPCPIAKRRMAACITALVECGKSHRGGMRGAGLLDVVDGGYEMHDYLDHSNAREQLELQRERARLKKARQREAVRRDLESTRDELRRLDGGHQLTRGSTVPPPVPGGQHGGQDAGQSTGTHHGTGGGTSRVRAAAPANPTQPNPTQPNPTQPTLSSSSSSDSSDQRDRPEGKISCPPDLRLADGQAASLAMNLGIPLETIDSWSTHLVGKFQGDPPRPRASWLRTLYTAISTDWKNPRTRDEMLGRAPERQPAPYQRPRGPLQNTTGDAAGLIERLGVKESTGDE